MTSPNPSLALKFRAVLVMGIFVTYWVNIVGFAHQHEINGVTYVHSHMHKAQHHHSKSGNHSAAQINIISHLAQYEADEYTPQTKGLLPRSPHEELLFSNYHPQIINWRLAASILRAPPCV